MFPLRYNTIPSERKVELRLNFRVAFKTRLACRKIGLAFINGFCHALLIAPLFQRIFLIFFHFRSALDIVS